MCTSSHNISNNYSIKDREYFDFHKDTCSFVSLRNNVRRVLSIRERESLLRNKDYFVFNINKTFVLGIKEKQRYKIEIWEDGFLPEEYFFSLNEVSLSRLFDTVPSNKMVFDETHHLPPTYFIRFKRNGCYDCEFSNAIKMVDESGTLQSIFSEEIGFLMPMVLSYWERIVLQESTALLRNPKRLKKVVEDGIQAEWLNEGVYDYGIITDYNKNVSDTIMWHHNIKPSTVGIIVTQDCIYVPDSILFLHRGQSLFLPLCVDSLVNDNKEAKLFKFIYRHNVFRKYSLSINDRP